MDPTEVLLPPGAAGQPDESIAVAHQVRTIPLHRVRQRLATLGDPSRRDEVRAALRLYLDLG